MPHIYSVEAVRPQTWSTPPDASNPASGIVIGLGISAALWAAIMSVMF